MNIALLGLSGSGKTTLANKLVDCYDFNVISNQIIFDYIRDRQRDYKKIQYCIDKAIFIPDDLYLLTLKYKLSKINYDNWILVDNPVSIGRFEICNKLILIKKSFFLRVPYHVAYERLMKRKSIKEINDLTPEYLKLRQEIFENNLDGFLKLKDSLIQIDAIQNPENIFNQVQREIETII